MAPGINSLYRFDEFELNPQKRTFERQGRRVLLSPKAFEVLTYLVANPERVVTKEELMKAAWPESFVEESNLAQHISWLRKALADRAGLIATIPGRGYQFTAPVDFLSPADLPPGSPAVLQRVTERTRIVIEETEPGPATDPRQLGTGRGPKPPPIWIVVAMATLLVGVGAFYYAKQNANPPPERKVVVAEFANSTGDTAFDRTLKRALEIELAQSPYMDVMGEGETVNTLRLMGQESGTAITPPIAKELCVRSNRDVLVSGAIASVGRDYLLTLVATDCNSGKQISAALAEAQDKEKVLAALDAVADHLRKGLGESKVSLERFQVPIAQATTSSLDALKAYSMGYSFDGSNTQRLLFFQKAVELDPQFAMAYSAMGSAYYNEGEAKLAALNFQKAFDLSDHVSEREKIIIQTHYYAEGRADLNKGIEAFQLWADTYPHDYVPWVDLANQYNVLGQYPAAIAAGQKALQMEPGKALNYSILARAYAHANRFEEAKSTAELAIQKKIDYDGIHATLFDVAFAQHDQAALERETEWAQEHPSSWYSWYFVDRQAEAAASAGKYKEAQDLFHKAHDVAVRENLTEAQGRASGAGL